MKVASLILFVLVMSWPESCRNRLTQPQRGPNGHTSRIHLDQRIPKPKPESYKGIRDAGDWQNPSITIGGNEIQLTCLAASVEYKTMRIEDLARELSILPPSGWPYGRVVAVQESGVRGVNDTALINQNLARVREILDSLGVRIEWWPSA
jgi:hypothetical protein